MDVLKSLRFIKYLGTIYAVWPLDYNASALLCFLYSFLWWFYFLNCIAESLITLNTCYHAWGDYTLATFSWLEFVSIVEGIVCLLNYKLHRETLQHVLVETEEYLKVPDVTRQSISKERALLFLLFMALITFLYLILLILYFTAPAITTWNNLLTTAYYPPSIRSPISDIFLYFHQIVVMWYTSVMINVDATVYLLIYVCNVRLKILASDLQEIKDTEGLKRCIRDHQSILRSGKNINYVTRMVVSKTVICFISYTVGAGLQIIRPDASIVSLQRFGVVLLINSIRLIMNAVCADDLSTLSYNINFSVYSTGWHDNDKSEKLTKSIMMLRCQDYLKIHVAGIMPHLNLAFVTGILSTSISYFTTLRAVTT